MIKSSLFIHHHYLDDVIRSLHETGIMQITAITKEQTEELENIQKVAMDPEAAICQDYETRLTTLIKILKQAQQKTSGIKALLNPELPVIQHIEDLTLEETFSYVEGVMTSMEHEILTLGQHVTDLKEQQKQTTTYLHELKDYKEFDIRLSDISTSELLNIKAGKTLDLSQLKNALQPLEDIAVFSKQIGKGKKKYWSVIIISHISNQKTVERTLSDHLQESELPLLDATPKEAIQTLLTQQKKNEKQLKSIQSQLQTLSKKHLFLLQGLREQIQIERIRKEIPSTFARTEETILIQGWVLEERTKEIKEKITEVTKDHVVFSFKKPLPNPDFPPTYMKTPAWAQSFRTLLELFATPKYNEVNPTVIMGIFFVLFFGVMLGDAGYGAIILLFSLFAYFRFKRFSPMIKNWSFMGIWLGLITTIVGLMTNSFFGDFISRFIYGNPEQPLYQATIAGIQFPVEPLKDPLTILTVALILGLIHLNVGIILGLYQAMKRHEYKQLLTERFCWIPLQIGGGLLIGDFILDWTISQPVFYIAIILVIIGIIQLFVSQGPVGFFGITGYVGDWLSYARLLALGLATSGMALAFNVVAGLLPDLIPYVGIILLPIVLVLAHLANLLLQALGAGVHSLRLQYVEFFNRFYEGGGHGFSPFQIKRIYTTVEKKR
jgi:V/A-type H+/Na+-transporting ATPase subunit I